jgi:hypothetical protein
VSEHERLRFNFVSTLSFLKSSGFLDGQVKG